MFEEKDSLVSTAYCGEAAVLYDDRRFTTKQGQLFSSLELRELEKAMVGVPKEGYVLEVGCGTARFSQHVAKGGYRVLATDPSPDMLRITSAKCKDTPNLTFSQQEGANLSVPDSTFDFVFSIRVTNQSESKKYALRMIKEMIRVTKQGGLILIEFVNSQRPLGKNSKNVRLSFTQISKVAFENNCCVESQRGILVFSQTILNKIPGALIPLWGIIERLTALAFWKWASRGYILLRKL